MRLLSGAVKEGGKQAGKVESPLPDAFHRICVESPWLPLEKPLHPQFNIFFEFGRIHTGGRPEVFGDGNPIGSLSVCLRSLIDLCGDWNWVGQQAQKRT
jgi:hypothetical protein